MTVKVRLNAKGETVIADKMKVLVLKALPDTGDTIQLHDGQGNAPVYRVNKRQFLVNIEQNEHTIEWDVVDLEVEQE